MKTLLLAVFLSFVFSAWNQSVLDSLFQPTHEKKPGFTIAILNKSEVDFIQSKGYASVKKDLHLNSDTRLAIASCSKQFTAFCIYYLENSELLKLTDDIQKYIPELNYDNKIQIRHLLSHTSGIRDHIEMLGWKRQQKSKYYDFEGTLKSLKHFNGLSFEPGEYFAYSNTGYVLLALIVERVSGRKFEEFADEIIFNVLGMKDTEFSFKRKRTEYGNVNPYHYDFETKKYKEFKYLEVNTPGGTGIYTTINDYIKWNNFLTNSFSSMKSLFVSDTLSNGKSVNYNYGFILQKHRGYDVIQHAGGWANYNFQHTIIPELQKSFIIGANNEYDYPIGIGNLLLDELIPTEKAPKIQIPVRVDEVVTGSYFSADFMTCELKSSEKETFIVGEKLYRSKHFNLYQTDGKIMDSCSNEFLPINDSSFVWSGGNYFQFPRLFNANKTITDTELSQFEGVYTSPELGKLKLKFNPKKKEISIQTNFGKSPKIVAVKNRLLSTNQNYNLYLNTDGTIILGNSRVFNVLFEKQ